MTALLLLSQLAMPNIILTPGVVRPLALETICATKWGKDHRHVTNAMKRHVAEAYGILWADHGLYEFDHLVPRSLGGADDILNLWPEPWADAHRKDALEVRLSKRVCAGTVPIHEAQQAIRKDWQAADLKYPRVQ